MRDAVRALDENPSDERLHDFRIETKRSRYAGELFASVPGSRGARFVRRATALQDALGAQHDAVRACAWLLSHGGEDTSLARACGWYAAQAEADRVALRTAWRPAWKKLHATSSKHRASGKRVAASVLGVSKSAGYREGGWGPKAAKYVFPALLALGFLPASIKAPD